jgi:hypothetical protein
MMVEKLKNVVLETIVFSLNIWYCVSVAEFVGDWSGFDAQWLVHHASAWWCGVETSSSRPWFEWERRIAWRRQVGIWSATSSFISSLSNPCSTRCITQTRRLVVWISKQKLKEYYVDKRRGDTGPKNFTLGEIRAERKPLAYKVCLWKEPFLLSSVLFLGNNWGTPIKMCIRAKGDKMRKDFGVGKWWATQ